MFTSVNFFFHKIPSIKTYFAYRVFGVHICFLSLRVCLGIHIYVFFCSYNKENTNFNNVEINKISKDLHFYYNQLIKLRTKASAASSYNLFNIVCKFILLLTNN